MSERREWKRERPSRRRYLFPEEAKRLLETARTKRGALAGRNYVLLALTLNAGLRVSEVSALNLSDFRDDTGGGASLLRIRGTLTREARDVFLSPLMAETLRRYVIEQRGIFGSDGPMFSSRWRGFDGKRLLQRALEYIFEAAAREAGIDGEFTFRCLRDTFGRFYWLATGDALALREQLGLRTVSATIDAHCRDDVYGTAANVRRFGEMVNP